MSVAQTAPKPMYDRGGPHECRTSTPQVGCCEEGFEHRIRRTGIRANGDVPWGTHFFLFYETKEDLLGALVPYFKVGLESGEFCVWGAYKPLTAVEVKRAMRRAVSGFDRYVHNHSIEIIP